MERDLSLYVVGSTVEDVRREVEAWEETHGRILFDVEVTPFFSGDPVAVDVFAPTGDEAMRIADSLKAHLGGDAYYEWELPGPDG
jgi:hypothetical protein